METNKPKAVTEQGKQTISSMTAYNITTSILRNNRKANDGLKTVRLILDSLSDLDLGKFINELSQFTSQQPSSQNVSAEEWINANKELLQKEAKKFAKKKSENYYWRYTANDFIDVMILAIYQFASSQTKISEEEVLVRIKEKLKEYLIGSSGYSALRDLQEWALFHTKISEDLQECEFCHQKVHKSRIYNICDGCKESMP